MSEEYPAILGTGATAARFAIGCLPRDPITSSVRIRAGSAVCQGLKKISAIVFASPRIEFLALR
jgi:hypothetical protein